MQTHFKKTLMYLYSFLGLQAVVYFTLKWQGIHAHVLRFAFDTWYTGSLFVFPFYVEKTGDLIQLTLLVMLLPMVFGSRVYQAFTIKWFAGCVCAGLLCHGMFLPIASFVGGAWPFVMGFFLLLFMRDATGPKNMHRLSFLSDKADLVVFTLMLLDLLYLGSDLRPGEQSLPQMLGIYAFTLYYGKTHYTISVPLVKSWNDNNPLQKSRLFKSNQPAPKYPLNPVSSDKIDQILDKINEKGMASLSNDEKYLLERASSQLKKDIF